MKCVFIGYSDTKKGYKCYHPSKRQVFIRTDVTLCEYGHSLRHLFRGRISLPQSLTPLLENGLLLEGTHLNAGEKQISWLQVNSQDMRRPTLPRSNSIIQLPCQLQSSGPTSIPLAGNDVTYVSLNIIDNIVDVTTIPLLYVKELGHIGNILFENFSYDSLSSTYRAFVSTLLSVSIPHSWKHLLILGGNML